MPDLSIECELNVDADGQKATALLAEKSGLSQQQIKQAMKAGAVWLSTAGKKAQRLRKVNKLVGCGDHLALYYREDILQQPVPEPVLIDDCGDYSIWFKPYGLACQGSRWGDFSTIYRWVELHHQPQKPCFLVHRLDRATSGLMVLAHSKKAARAFSAMFEQRADGLEKHYVACVAGDASGLQGQTLTMPLSGKTASTEVSAVYVDASLQQSLVAVRLHTGRKHQIRQHLALAGFPIVGDRLYGGGHLEAIDLQLQACELRFICPLTAQAKCFRVPEALALHPHQER